MTTKVTVFAGHGWPVDVTPMSIGSPFCGLLFGAKQRVAAGETKDFDVQSGGLWIHEVQPSELAAEKIPQLETL